MIFIKKKVGYIIKNIKINNKIINLHKFYYDFNNKIISIIDNKNKQFNNNIYKFCTPDNKNMYNIICIISIMELYISSLIDNISINYIMLYTFAQKEAFNYYKNLQINFDSYNGVDIKFIFLAIQNHGIIPYNYYLEFNIYIKNILFLNYKQSYTDLFISKLDIDNYNLIYKHFHFLFYKKSNDFKLINYIVNYLYDKKTLFIELINSIKKSAEKKSVVGESYIIYNIDNNMHIYYNNNDDYLNNKKYYELLHCIYYINTIDINSINIDVKFQYNDLNNIHNIAYYNANDTFELPKLTIVNYNLYLYNKVIFYYIFSKNINILSLTNNMDDTFNFDPNIGSKTSYIDGNYDDILIKNMIIMIKNNIILYVNINNTNKNYNYLLQYKINNYDDNLILNNLYNPYIKDIKLDNTDTFYNDGNISLIRLKNLLDNNIVLNIIIYGYYVIEININNNIYNKIIFNCIILVNNKSFYYIIDIIEDYFALVKLNNVHIYNLIVNISTLNDYFC